ncbi:MAG: hypothetical protein ABUL72_03895 [Armatimonadota bacterium]
MRYELYFYRPVPGRSLKEIYHVDISERDRDEALMEPHRAIDMRALADALGPMGFKVATDQDAFGSGIDGDSRDADCIELVLETGHAEGAVAEVWECHASLHIPLGEQHLNRDEEIEGLLRRFCVACHDHGLMGYDPKHDRELTPSSLHVLAEEISHGEQRAKPWWKIW